VAESQEEPFSQALTAWNKKNCSIGVTKWWAVVCLAEMFGIRLDLVFWLELIYIRGN